MRRIIWSASAEKKRDAALEYIAADSVRAALGQLAEIDRQVDLLMDQPHIGRLGRIRGTRELVIRHTPFIAVYRVTQDAVQILRFLHGAQNR